MNTWNNFFACGDTNSGKLNVISIILRWVWLKMGVATQVTRLNNWLYLKNGLNISGQKGKMHENTEVLLLRWWRSKSGLIIQFCGFLESIH